MRTEQQQAAQALKESPTFTEQLASYEDACRQLLAAQELLKLRRYSVLEAHRGQIAVVRWEVEGCSLDDGTSIDLPCAVTVIRDDGREILLGSDVRLEEAIGDFVDNIIDADGIDENAASNELIASKLTGVDAGAVTSYLRVLHAWVIDQVGDCELRLVAGGGGTSSEA